MAIPRTHQGAGGDTRRSPVRLEDLQLEGFLQSLHSVAESMVRPGISAESIVSDACMDMLKAMRQRGGLDHPLAWARAAVRTHCRRQATRRAAEREILVCDMDAFPTRERAKREEEDHRWMDDARTRLGAVATVANPILTPLERQMLDQIQCGATSTRDLAASMRRSQKCTRRRQRSLEKKLHRVWESFPESCPPMSLE